jgi:oxepin-CoA hydrolase/3-oxo-5,6-dehydrosuberyl-CoA semialdehyde dehydrogenase
MEHLDTDCVERFIARLGRIAPDAVPRWGVLRRDTLIEHFVWVVRYAMGRSSQVPFSGNWLTVHLVGPLFLRGLLPIPRNLQIPRALRERGVTLREPGDLETLRRLLEEYLNLVQADEFRPAPHPIFGDIGVDGWDRLHVRHFEHHLRQFGV